MTHSRIELDLGLEDDDRTVYDLDTMETIPWVQIVEIEAELPPDVLACPTYARRALAGTFTGRRS